MSLLEIRQLHVAFGAKTVVDQISLCVEKGEMLALVGESGSGKSLSALSVMGLLPESADCRGEVLFKGENLLGKGETVMRSLRGREIGMVFQEPMTALNPLHVIGSQIAEAIRIHQPGMSVDALRTRVQALLEEVGLGHFATRLGAYPHQLSGGERQRVMIAMAIANQPELLIADEPTTAVDVTIQARLLALLKQLQQQRQMGILFITHDLTIVRRMADRVAVMRHGQIVEQGRVDEVFSRPQHAYTQQLLASEPKGSAPPRPVNSPMLLEAQGVKVSFPVKKTFWGRVSKSVEVVKDISISLPEGSTLGIVGESGSGKTTLALALLRMVKSQGRIVFLGEPISEQSGAMLRPLRKRMQLVFQDPYGSLNPRMSVGQIIGEGLLVHEAALNEAQRNARIAEALVEVGLSAEMKDRYPHEFSGGQRQRVAIARAMVLRPRLVVLDEPTSALDLSVQAQIVALLRDLQARHSLSYIFISHDLRVVRAVSHELLVMRRGEVVESGTVEEVFTSPKQAYTKELIAAAFLQSVA